MPAARLLVLALLAGACRAASAPVGPTLDPAPSAEVTAPLGSVRIEAPPHVRQLDRGLAPFPAGWRALVSNGLPPGRALGRAGVSSGD